MKTKIIALILILSSSGFANTKNLKVTSNKNSKLSTDIKFDGQLVGGKIQNPFETLAVVENEKNIDDLIGVRTQFSDRSKKAKGMR